MVLVVKNPPANAGDARHWDRSLGREDALEEKISRILAWRIPWTEEAGGLHGVAESGMTEVTWHAGTVI